MDKIKKNNNKLLSFLIFLLPKIRGLDEISNLLSDLPRFYLDEDQEIAVESIKASGFENNIFIVEKLFSVIEEGSPGAQIEAIKALGVINPPLIHEKLIEYYSLISNKNIKLEILKLLNNKYYKNKEVINFNRGIVTDNNCKLDYKIISISGLVKARDFSFLSYIFPHGELRLIEEVLIHIIEQDGVEVEEFLKRQLRNLDYFSNKVLGYYLGSYTLKVGGAKVSVLNRILDERNIDVVNAYLEICEKGINYTTFAKRLFRILLSFSIFDSLAENSTEKKIRKLLSVIIDQANRAGANDIKELFLTCNVQLTNLFKNLVSSHISLSTVKTKSEFYYHILAQLFEMFLPAELLADVIEYFNGKKSENASLLISTMMQFIKTSEEKRLIEVCIPLFYEDDERKRLRIYTILKKVNPDIKIIISRMERILFSLILLKSKGLSKKIEEIYQYSISEKLRKIEGASIVILSRIKPNVVKDRIKSILISLEEDNLLIGAALKSITSLSLPDIEKIITDDFITKIGERDLLKVFLKGISELDYKIPNKILVTIFNKIDLFQRHGLKEEVIDLISEKGDWTVFQSLKSYILKASTEMKKLGIEIIRGLKRRDVDIKPELIINLLYSLLEGENIKNDLELYSLIISFLMELNDDYSFKIFESIVNEHNNYLAIEIIKRLPYYTARKIFFTIMRLVEQVDSKHVKEIKDYFSSFPDKLIDDDIKNYILKSFKDYHRSSKSFIVSEGTEEEKSSVSLIERPKVEFKIQYEQTKEVAVFFIDIANYTTLSSKLNLTGLMKIVSNFEKIVISTVESFNGRIIKKMGDGILAVFNHPLNSVVSGLIIQEKIKNFNNFVPLKEKFKARIGIHTGSVMFRDNDIFGDTVNIASRIESMAEPGTVLVSQNVYSLTRDFIKYIEKGPLKLKGLSEPVNSYMPENLTEDLIKYLEIKSSNKNAVFNGELNGEIARKLRVIMFNPDFVIPGNIDLKFGLSDLKKLFQGFSKYIESFAKDYLEEYEIKAWLQNKWNEILNRK